MYKGKSGYYIKTCAPSQGDLHLLQGSFNKFDETKQGGKYTKPPALRTKEMQIKRTNYNRGFKLRGADQLET